MGMFLVVSFVLSTIALAEETLVFGPQTFVKEKGKPQVLTRNFYLESTDWIFTLRVQNGVLGSREGRVSGATIILNGLPFAKGKDVSKQVETFEMPVSILVEGNNTLEMSLKGSPGSFISVEIVKEPSPPNRTAYNAQGDLDAWNTGEYVVIGWAKPPADTDNLNMYRSLSADGPWEKIFVREIFPYDPDSGYWESQINPNNAIDFVDGRAADLYYRLEAISETGEVLRSYAPVYVPKFVDESLIQSELSEDNSSPFFVDGQVVKKNENFALEVSALSSFYNEPFLTDEEYENFESVTLAQIRGFLKKHDSFLSGIIDDVDGEPIDPAKLVYDAARKYKLNPQLLLTTMQKENSVITATERPPDLITLELIMGYLTPSTIKEQINDAAWQFRKYFHDLETKGVTVNGWQVGVAKETQDHIFVIPANKAVAALFSYTPWAGEGWGGREKIGGNYLFWDVWYNLFKFVVILAPTWRFKVTPAYMQSGDGAIVSLYSLDDTLTKIIRYSPAKITQQLISGTSSSKWGPERYITLTNQEKEGDFFLYTGTINPSEYLDGYYNDGSGSGELYCDDEGTIRRCSLGIYNVLPTADIIIEDVSPIFETPIGPHVAVTAYFRQFDQSAGVLAHIFFVNYDETLQFALSASISNGKATYGWNSDFAWVRGILDVRLHEGDNLIQVYNNDAVKWLQLGEINYVGASTIVNVPFKVNASVDVGAASEIQEKEVSALLNIEDIDWVYPLMGK